MGFNSSFRPFNNVLPAPEGRNIKSLIFKLLHPAGVGCTIGAAILPRVKTRGYCCKSPPGYWSTNGAPKKRLDRLNGLNRLDNSSELTPATNYASEKRLDRLNGLDRRDNSSELTPATNDASEKRLDRLNGLDRRDNSSELTPATNYASEKRLDRLDNNGR
jgi:hypothetical protein